MGRLQTIVLAGLTAIASALPAMAGDEQMSALPTIILSNSEGSLSVEAGVLALADGKVDGQMSLDRSGPSGTVSTRQGRSMELAAGESATISQTGISFSPGDTIEISVILTVDGTVIGEANMRAGAGSD